MSASPSVCVVIHDVAPATREQCERVLRALADVSAIPVTLLAVPRYHGWPTSTDFEQWLSNRHDLGDEVALHGYTHLDEGSPRSVHDYFMRRVYTRGEGEFCDLPSEQTWTRLLAGIHWFRRMNLPLHGFVAPAWLLGHGSMGVLRALNFRYSCTLTEVLLLDTDQRFRSMGQVYSSATMTRRLISVMWNRALATAQQRNPLMRLELHPHDADHRRVRLSWQRLLDKALCRRQAKTLAQWVGEQSDGAQSKWSTLHAETAPMVAPITTSLG